MNVTKFDCGITVKVVTVLVSINELSNNKHSINTLYPELAAI